MEGPIYGLIGQRLSHSYSVPIHRELGNAVYDLYPMEPEALEGFLANPAVRGLNVTIPYKRAAMAYCDRLGPMAARIGSVNTLVRDESGGWAGFNTDAAGFLWMAERAGIPLACRKAVVLGSGGASLTVRAVLREQGTKEIIVVSRTGPDNYENLARHQDADLLVNATPVGMYPHPGVLPADPGDFPRLTGVLDLVYNPRRTALLLRASELGVPCSDGLPMLVAQAKAAEEYFFGKSIPGEENERILGLVGRNAMNIVLIGMPGSGKSTVGAILASMTGREAVDLDAEIEREAGRAIPDIFAERGEAAFRAMESAQAKKHGMESGKILITGGGIVKDPANYPPLRQNGRVYQLLRDVGKLPRDGRPLSRQTGPAALYRERAPLYARFRDAAVDNNGSPTAAAQEIWRDFCEHSGA